MQVHVNGEACEIATDATISALLLTMKVDAQQVAVEVNAQLVRRANHATVKLQAGDKIEIVTFVGGG